MTVLGTSSDKLVSPLLIPQIAACVRFMTPILRKIDLTWTLTVASVIVRRREITLFGSPRINPCNISSSRSERFASPIESRNSSAALSDFSNAKSNNTCEGIIFSPNATSFSISPRLSQDVCLPT